MMQKRFVLHKINNTNFCKDLRLLVQNIYKNLFLHMPDLIASKPALQFLLALPDLVIGLVLGGVPENIEDNAAQA